MWKFECAQNTKHDIDNVAECSEQVRLRVPARTRLKILILML